MASKKKETRRQQQAHTDALAASKPRDGRQEAAEEVMAEKERSHGGERERQVASHGQSTKDANTLGYVQPLPDEPRFPRPGSLAVDSDGSAGIPAEMLSSGAPQTEAVDTAGQSLAPSPSQPAAAQWASELADAHAGGQSMMEKVVPPGVTGPADPFAGFRAKAHREAASGQYDEIPGGQQLGPHEVATFDLSAPGHADALRGRSAPPAPNGRPAMPDEHSVVAPSMRAVSPADVKAAGS